MSLRGWDLNFWRLEDPHAYQRIWPHIDAVHCLGHDLWRRAVDRGAPDDLPVVFIPPGVDVAFFRPGPEAAPPAEPLAPLGSAARPLRVLSVGRLHWKKGYEWAVVALAELRRLGVHAELRVAGWGPDEALVRAAVEDEGLADSVTLLGRCGPAEVRDELAAAHVFLHSAVSEGFANAVLEAQAMAVPVVCCDADGLAENVEHGVTGFVVPRREPRAMAERLAELAADETARTAMGAAGRARVEAHFALRDQLAAIEGFYRDVHAGRLGRPGPRQRRLAWSSTHSSA
jgi:colanic acid/amylovoran biosynthesis glycosyltransferase